MCDSFTHIGVCDSFRFGTPDFDMYAHLRRKGSAWAAPSSPLSKDAQRRSGQPQERPARGEGAAPPLAAWAAASAHRVENDANANVRVLTGVEGVAVDYAEAGDGCSLAPLSQTTGAQDARRPRQPLSCAFTVAQVYVRSDDAPADGVFAASSAAHQKSRGPGTVLLIPASCP